MEISPSHSHHYITTTHHYYHHSILIIHPLTHSPTIHLTINLTLQTYPPSLSPASHLSHTTNICFCFIIIYLIMWSSPLSNNISCCSNIFRAHVEVNTQYYEYPLTFFNSKSYHSYFTQLSPDKKNTNPCTAVHVT